MKINIKENMKQNMKAVVLGLILTLGAGYAMAAFTGPACAPPGCNVDAPINVGGSPQIKTGYLQLCGTLPSTITPGYGLNVPSSSTYLDNFLVRKGAIWSDLGFIGRNKADKTSPSIVLYSDNDHQFGFYDNVSQKNVFGISNGKFAIADGTQGAGKVLTSNANGEASWGNSTGGGGTGSDLVGSATGKIYWTERAKIYGSNDDSGEPSYKCGTVTGTGRCSINAGALLLSCSDASPALNFIVRTGIEGETVKKEFVSLCIPGTSISTAQSNW